MAPSLGEIYEAFAYNYGWTREYIQKKLTRPLLKMYWFYMVKRQVKELENQARVMWGYDPKIHKLSAKQKKLAEEWQKDPLYNFPDDIIYFSERQIREKIGVSMRLRHKLSRWQIWDRFRGDACLGRFGKVAKRCSMNDELWKIWLEARDKGVELTLDKVKNMIRLDIARSKLYPPGWTDGNVDPPQWYVNQLKEEGKLDGILKEIDEVSFR